ncbi:serine/threonine-protein kinase [Amycolatopsis sp. CA-230715]|uniref:serine/threonine-protein kinase n=1 Tax=Amycolatopsis sp. CA-230715 TaxID=2745196 RepID=UPI001C02E14B|nr:serine/threonine-protein kinase [Amycolatopsis sp. CA-230715]QWF77075.1 Serine/threonine-protein kinase PknD [Amycolatopsis sp. CA-230715]
MTDEQTTTQAAGGRRVLAGRYVLLDELGRGGMGVVWRAEDSVIGRQVAIKELRLPDGAGDPGVFAERVLREVRTGGRLNDPAVVTVYDVVNDGGSTHIVMELVSAPTLSDLVRAHGPLPAAQAAAIGQQVLSALRAAHEAGIVHRDVKPGNIMVAPNGRVKLTDFGIAQAVDDPRITTSGMIVGSPAFMAPERVDGREALAASDLWSLGATLFFAVEGTVAFDRPTTAATLHAIMTEVPYLTRAQGPLASAIMGMLIANPEARISPDQADGLLAMAARGEQGGQATVHYGPPATRAIAAPENGAGAKKRGAVKIGAAVAAVVLLAGGVALGKWWGTDATDPAMKPTLTYGPGGSVQFDYSSSYPCYNRPLEGGGSVGSDNGVECKKSHDFEVLSKSSMFDHDSSTDTAVAGYPDEGKLRAWAEAECALGFHSDAVKPENREQLSYQALIPTSGAWTTPPTSSGSVVHDAYCVVTKRTGGQLDRPMVEKVK